MRLLVGTVQWLLWTAYDMTTIDDQRRWLIPHWDATGQLGVPLSGIQWDRQVWWHLKILCQ